MHGVVVQWRERVSVLAEGVGGSGEGSEARERPRERREPRPHRPREDPEGALVPAAGELMMRGGKRAGRGDEARGGSSRPRSAHRRGAAP